MICFLFFYCSVRSKLRLWKGSSPLNSPTCKTGEVILGVDNTKTPRVRNLDFYLLMFEKSFVIFGLKVLEQSRFVFWIAQAIWLFFLLYHIHITYLASQSSASIILISNGWTSTFPSSHAYTWHVILLQAVCSWTQKTTSVCKLAIQYL